VLSAGCRVFDAAEPPVEAHASDALLVAAEAKSDVARRVCPRLRRELGICDLAAHDADQVAMTIGERAFRLEWILEATDTNNWQFNSLAKGRWDEERVPRWDVHARLDHEQAGSRNADGRVDVVDLSSRLGELRDLYGLLDGRAALDQFVAAQPDTKCESAADDRAHGGDDLDEQAGAVIERSAVLIGPAVRRRREEPAHDR